MHHVLEHLQHPKDILRKIRKILSPEGIIIFEVPNQFFVFTREVKIMLKVKKSEKPYNPYHHIYFFSPYTLKNLIEAGGYNIYELNQIPSIVTNSLKVRVYKSLANLFRMGYTNNIEAVIGAKKY
jgi:2-polyprenyl-3-methyl-5-hydroxy-6-metoxy-1,4-benzoquinol methylase